MCTRRVAALVGPEGSASCRGVTGAGGPRLSAGDHKAGSGHELSCIDRLQCTRNPGSSERGTYTFAPPVPPVPPELPRAAGVGGLPAPRVGLPEPLGWALVEPLLRAALEEDLGRGDVTSESAVPEQARARASLVAKEAGVLAGSELFLGAFSLLDPAAVGRALVKDGERFERGARLAVVEGRARALLSAERTALNFVQRMCGIAARTRAIVDLAGGRVRVLDTRKTTPLLRRLEKYAVRCGGGENHRFGLDDEAMVKENHLELAGKPLGEVLAALRARLGPGVRITAEARDEAEALAGARGGADVVLLDNMSAAEMARLCPLLRRVERERGRALEIEASGGIDERTLDAVSRTGVDRISLGGLTHSARALDLSLDLEPLP